MSEHDDANATDQTAGDAESRPQDPRVELLRPDPSQPATQVRTLRGLWGNSDRPGYKRLYLSSSLESYAEFRVEDVLDVADIAPPRAPPTRSTSTSASGAGSSVPSCRWRTRSRSPARWSWTASSAQPLATCCA